MYYASRGSEGTGFTQAGDETGPVSRTLVNSICGNIKYAILTLHITLFLRAGGGPTVIRLLYGRMLDGRAMLAQRAIGSRWQPGSVAGVKRRLHEMLPELALVVPVVQVYLVRDAD